MKSARWFRDYEERERRIMHQFASRAMTGDFVENAHEVYGDRVMAKRLAFHRNGAPLSALLFLYDQVVVYVPPSSKRNLQERFGLPWGDFIELAERRCIVPVVGHPTHYAGQKHFGPLFDMAPASVWARGDELALEFAGGHEYWAKVNRDHPFGSFPRDPLLQAKYRRHFPGISDDELVRRIDREVRTNFVDMCIFGYEPLATFLLSDLAGSVGPRKLIDTSELVTYPSLMGMGGTPNYGLEHANAAMLVSEAPRLRIMPRRVGPEAAMLVEGLSLATPSHVDPQLVIEFHSDSMAAALWGALEVLEERLGESSPDPDDLAERAERAKSMINEALREVNGAGYLLRHRRTLDRVGGAVKMTMKLSPVLPLATLFWSPFDQELLDAGVSAAGLAASVAAYRTRNAVASSVERQLVHHLSSRGLDGMTAQFWWLSKWTSDRAQ